MKKIVTSLVLSALALFATTININSGWNLIGAIGAIKPGQITCAKTVWTYKGGDWKLYAKGSTDPNNYGFTPLTDIQAGQGFWVNASTDSCNINFSNLTNNTLAFTANMFDDDTYYNVSWEYGNPLTYTSYVFSYNGATTLIKYDSNQRLDKYANEAPFEIIDGKLVYDWSGQDWAENGEKSILEVTQKNDDYYDYTGIHYNSDGSEKYTFSGRAYKDETKADAYLKTFVVKDDSVFAIDANESFTKPEVIKHVDFATLNTTPAIYTKLKLDNGGNSANSCSLDSSGYECTAIPLEGATSRMRLKFRNMVKNSIGVAVKVVPKYTLPDPNNRQRARLGMNAYNDGNEDISIGVKLKHNKIDVDLYKEESQADVPNSYRVIVSKNDGFFDNKEVILSTWVSYDRLNYYVSFDNEAYYGYYYIGSSYSNPLEDVRWAQIQSKINSGGDGAIIVKTKAVYTLR